MSRTTLRLRVGLSLPLTLLVCLFSCSERAGRADRSGEDGPSSGELAGDKMGGEGRGSDVSDVVRVHDGDERVDAIPGDRTETSAKTEVRAVCPPGETSCKDRMMWVCEQSGASWQPFQECGDGETCHEGACCSPACGGKQCGADGCGGECGECPEGELCGESGMCVCLPQCGGKECGDDSCGGSCGGCQAGFACAAGACLC
ncbi:MAG: hypothetical protein FJ109_20220, partial [Deltaproteobacteria bacterium]|nr:hypothetical protein [Deltaproteobacteria bacterium]